MLKSKRGSVERIQIICACLFFASIHFEVFSPFMEKFSIAKMAAYLYLASLIFTPLYKLVNLKNIQKNIISCFLLIGLITISSLINGCEQIFYSTLFQNIIMFWMVLNHYRRDDRLFEWGMLSFSICAAIIGFLFMQGIGVGISLEGRMTMFDDNENAVGLKMATAALFLLSFCLRQDKRKASFRPWLLFLTIPIINLMFATASRTALVVFAVGLFVFFLLYPSKKKSVKFLWFIVGFVVIYIGYNIVLQQELLMERMNLTVDEGNLSGRDIIWAVYLELILDNPILGVGLDMGGFEFSMSHFEDAARSPHQVLIEVAVYSGILGLATFLFFLFYMYKDAFLWLKTKARNITPLILCISTVAMIMAGQALGTKLFWVIAAYATSYQLHRECLVKD